MKWRHACKGIIEGEVVRDDGIWVDIRLSNTVNLLTSRCPVARAGEIIGIRKSFLTVISEEEQP